MTQEQAFELVQQALDNLRLAGLLADDVAVNPDMVLLGQGSPLDSIAFVTFMTDLEDLACDAIEGDASDFALVLNDLHDFNADETKLVAGKLAAFVADQVARHGTQVG